MTDWYDAQETNRLIVHISHRTIIFRFGMQFLILFNIPSRKQTYPTLGKGWKKRIFKHALVVWGWMLVSTNYLAFVQGDVLLCTMVNHRETTIWENIFGTFFKHQTSKCKLYIQFTHVFQSVGRSTILVCFDHATLPTDERLIRMLLREGAIPFRGRNSRP